MRKSRAKSPVVEKAPFLLPLKITDLGDGRFLGRCPSLPGLNVEADSVEEVLRLAPRVARALIEAMREKGVSLPKSLDSASPPMNVHLLVAA